MPKHSFLPFLYKKSLTELVMEILITGDTTAYSFYSVTEERHAKIEVIGAFPSGNFVS